MRDYLAPTTKWTTHSLVELDASCMVYMYATNNIGTGSEAVCRGHAAMMHMNMKRPQEFDDPSNSLKRLFLFASGVEPSILSILPIFCTFASA